MHETSHILKLTWEQFDALEEASDIMAMEGYYCNTMEDAVHYLSRKYIAEIGPHYEVEFEGSETPLPN